MANDVYITVCDCHSSAQSAMHDKRQRQLKLFFQEGPLEYIGMDILRHLPKTRKGDRFAVEITDRYTKRTKAIPTFKTNSTTVTCIFLVH